jgi:hypothetical protein
MTTLLVAIGVGLLGRLHDVLDVLGAGSPGAAACGYWLGRALRKRSARTPVPMSHIAE